MTQATKKNTAGQKTVVLETLEQRVLYSIDFLTSGLNSVHEPGSIEPQLKDHIDISAIPAGDPPLPATKLFLPDTQQIENSKKPEHYQSEADPIDSNEKSETKFELVIVDSGVENSDKLLSDLNTTQSDQIERQWIWLDPEHDGVKQITELLDGVVEVDAIHIISHGDSQGFQLGSSSLDINTASNYKEDLSKWSLSLTHDADLLIYGCDLASTASGRALIDTISDATNSDVAASTDVTGHSQLGGDWELEYEQGDISTAVAISSEAQSSWDAALSTTDISSGIELNTDGGNDAYFLISNGGSILTGATQFTYEIIFSAPDIGVTTGLLNYFAGGEEISFFIDTSNQFLIWIGGTQHISTAIDYSVLKDGNIHSVSVTWDNTIGDWQLYVDGQLTDSGTGLATGHSIVAGGTMIIGQEQDIAGGFDPDHIFSGTIYDIRLWNQVRTEAEISPQYNQKLDLLSNPPGLISNWQMTELTGATNDRVLDAAGGNNLLVGHVTGFTPSTPSEDLTAIEDAAAGTSVGFVIPHNPEVTNDIVFDGLFREGATIATNNTYGTGATIGGWTVANGNIESHGGWIGAGPLGGVPIELGTTAAGKISQTLTTEVGQSYQVTFALTGDFSSGNLTKYFETSFGVATTSLEIKQPEGWSNSNPLWEHRTITFSATSSSTILSFESLETAQFHPIITNVQVTKLPTAVTAILSSDPTISYNAATNKFYQVSAALTNWDNAQTAASNNLLNGVAGQLVNIRTPYENTVIPVAAAGSTTKLHIGGTDATSEGTWNWVDNGTETDTFYTAGATATGSYSAFKTPEPDSLSGDEDQLSILMGDRSWTDTNAVDVHSSIIEWDANEVLTNYNFALTDDADGRFAIDSHTGEITVANGSLLELQSYDITVAVTGADNTTFSKTMPVAVNSINEAPAFNQLDGIINYIAGTPPAILDNNVLFTDTELDARNNGLGNYAGATLTLARDTGANTDDIFTVTASGGLAISGTNLIKNGSPIASIDTTSTPGLLSVVFTEAFGEVPSSADVNNILIRYSNNTATPPASVTVNWGIDDGNTGDQGAGGALQSAGSSTINFTIPPILDITAPTSTIFISEDTAITFNGAEIIQVDDGISTDQEIQVLLAVDNGTLTLSGTTGVSFRDGSDATESMVLQGRESNINAALNGMVFTPDAEYSGSTSLTVQLMLSAYSNGEYKFESDATDTSIGPPRNGTLVGDAAIISDPARGNVLNLDGAGYVSISSDFGQPNSIAIGGWVNLNAGASRSEFISIDDRVHIALDENGSGVKGSVQVGASSWVDLDSNIFVAGTGWRHIAYSVNTTNDMHRLYIDGVEVASSAIGGPIYWAGATNSYIGVHPPSGGHLLNGLVDEVRIYTSPISAEEVMALATDNHTLVDTVAITVAAINDSPLVGTNTGAGTRVGGSVTITTDMLNESDPDDFGTELTYNVTGTSHGLLERTSNPGVAISNFTQADIDTNQITFVHDGLSGSNGNFNYTLVDGGEDGATPYNGSFSIFISGAIADSYSTDEDTPLSVGTATGALANDGKGGLMLGGNPVLNFDARTDTDGNALWTSNVGTVNLTLTGATYTTSPDNPLPGITSAFDLSGIASGATAPALDSLPEINGAQSATLEAWIFIDSLSGNNMIFDTGNTGNTGISLLASDGQLVLAVADSGSLNISTTNAPTAGSWHHIALTVELQAGSDQINLYVDGVLATGMIWPLSNWAPGPFGLGTTNGSTVGGYSGDLTGQIAHFRIHDQTLDAATISYHATNPGAGSATPYVASYNPTTAVGNINGVFAAGSFNYDPNGQFEYLAAGQSTTDTFDYTYNDGYGNTDLATVTITINGVNDIPVQSAIESAALPYTENDPATIITSTLEVTDVDAEPINSATVSITGNFVSGQDTLSVASQSGISGTFNSSSGILTLSGLSSVANYQTALRSITYGNTSDTPSTLTRTVTFQINDGVANSNLQSRDIVISEVNDPPVLSAIETTPVSYTENSPSIGVTGSLAIDDDDDTTVQSATVSISGNFTFGQDVLEFTDQPGITGNFDTTTGIMTLTGSATLADYETAIHSITYHNTSDNPSTQVRTVSFFVNDGNSDSNQLSRTILPSAVNDAPGLTNIEVAPVLYTENGTPIGITGNLAVSDIDDSNIETATVSIIGNFATSEDILAFTDQTGITGSYDAINGVLTLTGSATLADYETALHLVTYENTSDNPSTLDRTVSFLANDGDDNSNQLSRTISLTAINDPPQLSGIEALPASYTEGGLPVIITGNVAVADDDDTNIENAIVSITSNFAIGEDVLNFSAQPGITGSYNSTNGELTLSGSATLADYQTAIRSITYENTSDNPSTLTRTVSIVVNDGDTNSIPVARNINFTPINDPPLLSNIENFPVSYSEGASPTIVSASLSVADVDDTSIESMIVSITGNFSTGEDVLAFTDQPGITGNYDAANGELTLTGPATLADFESATHLITYHNTSDNPSALDRTITFVANDGDVNSNPVSRDIAFTAVNDAPVLSAIELAPAVYTENGSPIGITANLALTDADDLNIESATVSITANFATGEDVLTFSDQPGITGNYDANNGILTLTGSATLTDYETALHSVTYHNASDNPSTPDRTVSFVVNDGAVNSNLLSRNIQFTAVNDAPVLSTIEAAPALYTENGAPIGITGNLAVADVDDTNIESATVSITTNFTVGEDVLAFTDQPGITGSYDAANGVLTLTGPSTLANYQAAIHLVTYHNTSDNPSTLGRTVSFIVNDGDDTSNLLSRNIQFTAVNDAPVLSTIEAATALYTENSAPVGITGNLAVDDVDDTAIESATISISSNFAAGEDVLAFTDQPGITGSFDAVNGVLNLTGSATLADYETVLHSVTYHNTSDNPSTLDRTISFVVNDGNDTSNLLLRNIQFTAVNDAPVLSTIEIVPALYTENSTPIGITGNLAVADVDDSNIESATISISSNFAAGEDVLAFTDQPGITGSFDAVNGVLSLTGSATLADYETVLHSVTYHNTSDNPSTLDRIVSFVVNDGDTSNLLSRNIQFTAVNDAPLLSTIEAAPALYTENGAPVGITGNLAVADVDDTAIESATISISSNFAAGEDVLAFTDQPGITGSFDAVNGVLTLTGSATLDDYETVLHSVTYHNTGDNPSTLDRTISFVVNDGDDTSNLLSRNIQFTAVNDAPVLSTIETAPAPYTENSTPIGITANIAIADVDNTTIKYATVSITANFAAGEDVLAFTDQPGITGSYDAINGVLTLTGSATLADYETAIRTVTFQNTSDNPSTLDRTVSFVVNDGDDFSNTLSRNVSFTAVNDSPTLTSIEAAPALYTENDAPLSVTGNLAVSDVDDTNIESATVFINGNFAAGEDVLAFTDQPGITGSYDVVNGVLTLTGSATLADYEIAIRTVTFQNTSDNPSTLDRTVSFVVNDGADNSNLLSRNIQFTAVNDAPVLSTIETTTALYTENSTPIGITGNLAAADVDDTTIESATVSITDNFAAGEDILTFTDQLGITGSYDAINGVLSLTGSTTLANYETALHLITYQNTSDNPSALDRTISFVVNDGDDTSNLLSRNIQFTSVNDAPVLSTIEIAPALYTENSIPIGITGNLAVADVDDSNIESATVSITGNFTAGEDVLSFTDQTDITGNYDAINGVLTLTGSATLADYEIALHSVAYQNNSDDPSTAIRTVSFIVNDGDSISNLASRDIELTPANDAPVLSTIEISPALYTENGVPVGITGNLTVADVDDTNIESASVSIIGNFASGEDILAFTDRPGISGNYDASNGVLTLTGSATRADYEAALHSVTYQNTSDNPSTPDRTVSFVVSDGDDTSNLLSRDVAFTAVNDLPVLTNIEIAPALYTENGSPIAITGNLAVSDIDDTEIESATVSIVGNFVQGEDELIFTDQSGITGSYDAMSGELTLTGAAPLTEYETAIHSIRYQNTSDNPSALNRTVSIVVNDGDIDSNLLSRGILLTAVNDSPEVSTIETAAAHFSENGVPILITGNLSVSDIDDTNIESATISITGNFAAGEDVLMFTDQPVITGNYDASNGIMMLNGSATLADYETAIHSVTYQNTSDKPSTLDRTVSFVVRDNDDNSNLLSRDITISATNDSPVLSTIETAPALYTENAAAIAVTGNLMFSDVDDTHIESASVSITGNFAADEDVLTFVDQSGITGNYNSATGVLTLSGSATLADYETASRSIGYENTSDNPSVLDRTVSFQVNDGDDSSNQLSRNIVFTSVNDSPVLINIEAAPAIYTENAIPVGITGNLNISDIDDTNIESATVSITTNFINSEDELIFTDQSGITGVFNAATGEMFLSGSASIADYKTAIHSVRYNNTSDNPSDATRVVTFVVNDGDVDSNVLFRSIEVVPVNDTPSITNIEQLPVSYTENDVPTLLSNTLALSDSDDIQLETATVAVIGNFTAGEDLLLFNDQAGITGNYDATTGILTLSGSSSISDYQTALQSIRYENSSDNPTDLTRTVSISTNDGDGTSNTITRDIAFTAVNDSPVLSGTETVPVPYTENSQAINFTNSLTISDLDDTNIELATISITDNFTIGEDKLLFTDQSGITGSYSPVTGILSLTGTATLDEYQIAIRSVTYQNTSDNPSTLDRLISVTVFDGNFNSNPLFRNIVLTAVNDSPALSDIENTPAVYIENSAPIGITATLALADIDNTNIESATVSISDNYTATEDELVFVDQAGITGLYQNGLLTLSGTATVAEYQQALRNVTYTNISDDPNPLTRQITYSINDGDLNSNQMTRAVEIVPVNDAPVATSIDSLALPYTENAGQVPVSTTLALNELDDINLESATVQITGNYRPVEDRLNYAGTGNITASWNPLIGQLTLSGSHSVMAYQTALRSVTYENINDNPDNSIRTLSFSVNDGSSSSNITQRNIVLTAVNDAPVQLNIEISDVVFTENAGPIAITSTLALADLDDHMIESAIISIVDGYNSVQDRLSVANNTSTITATWNPARAQLTLAGTDTLAAYQSALRSVVYENTDANPSLEPRTITFSINDGNADSNLSARQLVIVPINNAPATTNIESATLDYIENAGGITITSTLRVDDIDNAVLDAATVAISNGFHPAEDTLLFNNTSNITGSWDSIAGTLTLSGADTLIAYQTALRSVQYENSSEQPAPDIRTLDFRVFDGELLSNSITRTITVTSVNDAPTGAGATLTFLEDNNYILSRTDFGFSDVLDNNNFSAVDITELPVNGQLILNGIPLVAGQKINISDIDANLLVFSPQPDANGIAYDHFGFNVQDDGGNAYGGNSSDPQQRIITFDVTSVSDAPSGEDNTVSTPEDIDYIFSKEDFQFTDPLDNDTFISIVITSLPNTGILKIGDEAVTAGRVIDTADIESGLLIYTPPSNDTGRGYHGFGYRVQDSGSNINGGEFTDPTDNFISFDLPGVNDPPLLITENATVDEGSENTLTTAVLTATDADDLLSNELTFSLGSVPLHGKLTLNGNTLSPGNTFTLAALEADQLIYTHDGSETSSDFFDVSVQDGGEDGSIPSSGRFSISITEVIDPAPDVKGDQLNLAFGQPFDSLDGDLLESGYSELSNAALASNTVLLVELVQAPAHGTIELNSDGTFSYQHNGSAVLTDFFTYRVTNEDGVSTLAQVDISIAPPLAAAFTASGFEQPDIPEVEQEAVGNTEETPTEGGQAEFLEPDHFAPIPQVERARADTNEIITNLYVAPVESRVALISSLEALDVKQHNQAKDAKLFIDSTTLSVSGFEVLLELKSTLMGDVTSNANFLDGLSRFGNDLDQSEEQNARNYKIGTDAGLGISLSITAGILGWVLRGGALFASAMASTPLWNSIDPLKVVRKRESDEEVSEADDKLEDFFSKAN